MAERELAILVTAKDLASRVMRGVRSEANELGKIASRGISNTTRNLERMAVVAGGAAVAGIGYSVKAAMDFEAQLNVINTVAHETPARLSAIGDGIRKLSRETGTSLDDLTAAYYDLVSAGIDTANAQGVLTAANTLAIGGLSTTAEAVDLLTTAINSYGGDATKAAQFADQFAQAIAAGKVTAAEIAATFAQVGPLAASMGIGVDEISAALGQMTAQGTPASEAMTQMRSAMIALQRQTPEMKRVLGELGIENAELFASTHGLVPLYQQLREKADELGIPLIKLTGRVEGTQFALQNTGDAFDDYLRNLEDVQNASGTAADQMSERQQGLAYQLGILRANLNDAAITIGTALLPQLNELAQQGVGWLTTHQDDVKRFAEDLARGFRDAVTWARSLDWGAITGTLQTLGGVGKTILDTFLRMPSWVQVAVVSGWGLNKLSGGALGALIGHIGAGIIRGVMNMNAGVVNLNAGVVRGGGLPVGGGGGAAGGAARGARGIGGFLGGAGRLIGIGGAIGGAVLQGTADPTDQGRRLAGAGSTIAGAALTGLTVGGVPGAVAGAVVGSGVAAGQEVANVAGIIGRGQESLEQVVEGRMSDNLGELQALRADLQEQIRAGGGDPLRDLLKGAFVDPELRQQLDEVELAIQAAARDAAGGRAEMRADARSEANSVIGEFNRAAAQRTRQQATIDREAGRAASSDRAMLGSLDVHHQIQRETTAAAQRTAAKIDDQRAVMSTGFQAMDSHLGVIAAKDPTVNVTAVFNAQISATVVQQRIYQQRQATGRGFQERV